MNVNNKDNIDNIDTNINKDKNHDNTNDLNSNNNNNSNNIINNIDSSTTTTTTTTQDITQNQDINITSPTLLNTSTDIKIYSPLMLSPSSTNQLSTIINNNNMENNQNTIPSIIDTYLIKPPSWLSNLREEWVNEIGAMTESKKIWFFTQNQNNNNVSENNSISNNDNNTNHNLTQSNFNSNIKSNNVNIKNNNLTINNYDTLSNISSLSSNQHFDLNIHDSDNIHPALVSPRSTSSSPVNSSPSSPKLDIDTISTKNRSYSIMPNESSTSPSSGKYKAISSIFKTVSPSINYF